MAEALAIVGGGAAFTQLFHYAVLILSRSSALSHQLRHPSEKIQWWLEECSSMLAILRDARRNISNTELAMSGLLQQCRRDIAVVELLLQPFRHSASSRRSSRLQQTFFVLRREEEIEQRLTACKGTFQTLALGWLMLTRSGSNARVQRISAQHDLVMIASRSNMGIDLFYERQYEAAKHVHHYVYSERTRRLGEHHHETLKSKANIAMTINEMGDHQEAERMYRDVMTLLQVVLGPHHPDTIKTYTNLATTLHDQGKYEEADEALTTTVTYLRSIQEHSHEDMLEALQFRAIVLQCMQRYMEALHIASQVYRQRRFSLGFQHDDTQRALSHVRDLAEDCEEQRSIEAFISCETAISV